MTHLEETVFAPAAGSSDSGCWSPVWLLTAVGVVYI
jgi:hypothetical protein